MQRREFIAAAVGMAAAVASASQAFAQDYPDVGAIKKMPVGEGAAGAAKKGIEGEAGAGRKASKVSLKRSPRPSGAERWRKCIRRNTRPLRTPRRSVS